MTKTARDVLRETLMRERVCRKPCYEVRSCDCARDTLAQIEALTAAGFAVVPVEATGKMVIAGGEAQTQSLGSWGAPDVAWRAMLKAARSEG